MTLWHGRMDGPMDEGLWALSESFSFDVALWPYDVEASRAHVAGLLAAGLLSAKEATALDDALTTVADEFASGRFVRAASDEDVHTAVERRVTEIAGEVGAKLHTARSRNDQVDTPRPHRRTNPSASLWRKVSASS